MAMGGLTHQHPHWIGQSKHLIHAVEAGCLLLALADEPFNAGVAPQAQSATSARRWGRLMQGSVKRQRVDAALTNPRDSILQVRQSPDELCRYGCIEPW